ncbi:ATP-binding protein [Kribbella sp. NPDC049174]|uniref:ATP-binding protein n=1 Tax=Kribbella sp. NPDC049174 TaxID=3364112 RepID=UPI003718CD16
MSQIELTPDPHLLESMRAVGYSFETAVADIIDNSITAGANTIHVLTSAQGNPRVSVFDDGDGMDRQTAIVAMRLAAQSPSASRRMSDLGRFGLGLKTASLSQCRQLTVATKQAGQLTVLRWDLDHVLTTGRWLVLELEDGDAISLLGWNLLAEVDSGTLVCWTSLDLLMSTEGPSQADFDAAVARVRDHCTLVFHRFVTGDDVRKISMTVNGNQFVALDPFLSENRATDRRTEDLQLAGQAITVVAYTLPFINKLTATERQRALAPGSFRDSQGFYVYRAGRLVVWGTWFRLNPKTELSKLARVKVDIPNSLDHLWALDIKKSAATPPRDLREALKVLAGKFVEPSSQVHRFRGRKEKELDSLTRAWDVIVDRDSFRYAVNREHPVIKRFADLLDPNELERFEVLLELVEQTFPLMDAHNRLGQDATAVTLGDQLERAVARAVEIRGMFDGSHPGDDSYIELLSSIEPYCQIVGFQSALRAALGAG